MSDLVIIRGDDRDYDITITDEDGDPLNITGSTLKFAARFPNSRNRFLSKSSAQVGEIDMVSEVNGQAVLHIDPADTLKLPQRSTELDFDLELTQVGGTVTTLVNGTLSVEPDVAS
jgi:hypothetical protein